MYRLDVAPNITHMKRYSALFLSVRLSYHRTCCASLFCLCTRIWRNAFWMSPVTQCFRIWFQRRMSNRSSCSGGLQTIIERGGLGVGPWWTTVDNSHLGRFCLLSNDCLVGNVVHYLARLMRGYRFHNSSGHLFLHYVIIVLQLPGCNLVS